MSLMNFINAGTSKSFSLYRMNNAVNDKMKHEFFEEKSKNK